MAAILTHNAYGKAQVRLTKVTRHADRHDLMELTVAVQLEGAFDASYTQGDNSQIVATDTMKNVVYALAKDHALTDPESFGQALAAHFIENYAPVSCATVQLVEAPWQRIVVRGQEHPHAFFGNSSERRTCTVRQTRRDIRIEAGLEGLLLLKTTDSAFKGFLRDRYTTLPETDDRMFATRVTARWQYNAVRVDWNPCHAQIRQTLLETFADHHSLSVQQTLHAMGAAALAVCPQMEEISLTMPNQHRLLVNLKPFGLENRNEVFVATDEPHGLITGTLRRM